MFNTKPQLKHVFKYPGVSGFSTWGPGLDLTLKPDIVAPGENIYSTGNDNSYFISSGTSMSAPKVAGASAMFLPVTKKWQKKMAKKMGKTKCFHVYTTINEVIVPKYSGYSL
ncbi:S8 family serine peptidase [Streptococcus uberis]|nr:S8 family serine peptidase [Streptococcus uberis]